MGHDMFHIPVPVLEKILRPIIVYLCLIVFIRVFGKRELAQLNPFDLVVLLSLSNTVQNAMIGDDNSLSGGLVGAFSLLTINWLLNRVLFKSRRLNAIVQGSETVLVTDGKIDEKAMVREALRPDELMQALRKQNVNTLSDVKCCSLEPSGTFSIELNPETQLSTLHDELLEKLEALTREVRELKQAVVAG